MKLQLDINKTDELRKRHENEWMLVHEMLMEALEAYYKTADRAEKKAAFRNLRVAAEGLSLIHFMERQLYGLAP